ncbi:MAG: hypothetical protein M3P45_09430 [Acidobacteriota bacterium]|nr:hypothetical protein [Acidobacteriota bacterium]
MPTHLLGLLGAMVPVLVQFVLFLRWLHRRMRADEIARAFVRDLAVTHLPHIYSGLREIARRQGIELQQAPPVRFSDLNGYRRQW